MISLLSLPSKFAQLLLIQHLNYKVIVMGGIFLKIENDSTKERLSFRLIQKAHINLIFTNILTVYPKN
jgi:hypothetical protein